MANVRFDGMTKAWGDVVGVNNLSYRDSGQRVFGI